jgi:hypothetical protein
MQQKKEEHGLCIRGCAHGHVFQVSLIATKTLSIPKYLTLDFFDIILTTRIIQKIKFIYHFNGSIVYYIIYFNYIFIFNNFEIF